MKPTNGHLKTHARVINYPSVQIRFGLKLHSLTDEPTSENVTLTAQTSSSSLIHLTANYVLGTDGANSTTRNLVSLPFSGHTYDLRMIGMDVLYDFVQHESFSPLNFIVHPTDWAVIAYTGQTGAGEPSDPTVPAATPPQYRVAYVESPDLPSDTASILQRAEQQMAKYARSGAPWSIVRAEPYTISQRCSARAMVGRVALAGDALHCNNPIGGLGLTGGILDAFAYGNALVRVVCGREPVDALVACADERLRVWRDVTDGLSRGNLDRLCVRDEEEGGVARKKLFDGLNGDGREVVAEKVRMGIERMVGDDFSTGTERWIRTKV